MKVKKEAGKTEWNDEFYVRTYQLARAGVSQHELPDMLKVGKEEWKRWWKRKPALRKAFVEGAKKETKLSEWIFGRLSGKYKKLWDRINRVERTQNGVCRVELLFDKYGEGARKYLFLYALVNSHYNPSQACRKVNVPYSRFKKWVEEDYEFARMIQEIEEHKNNFFEGKLYELVDQGDSKAVMFVNKTRNRMRGYGEKLEVEYSGSVIQEHRLVLDEQLLDRLSVGTRRELLEVVNEVEQGGTRQTLLVGSGNGTEK